MMFNSLGQQVTNGNSLKIQGYKIWRFKYYKTIFLSIFVEQIERNEKIMFLSTYYIYIYIYDHSEVQAMQNEYQHKIKQLKYFIHNASINL